MCGILGLSVHQNNNQLAQRIFNVLMEESSIRGVHAHGWAYPDLGDVAVVSKVGPPEKIEKASNQMIGHCRYSTSGGLEHNQPMRVNNRVAIVHNGVISQESPEKWPDVYRMSGFKTDNDTEILAKSLELHPVTDAQEPLSRFQEASMAVIELYGDSTLRFYRNHRRPLWWAELDEQYAVGGCLIASTEDILTRTLSRLGLVGKVNKTNPFTIYSVKPGEEIQHRTISWLQQKYHDLQE